MGKNVFLFFIGSKNFSGPLTLVHCGPMYDELSFGIGCYRQHTRNAIKYVSQSIIYTFLIISFPNRWECKSNIDAGVG